MTHPIPTELKLKALVLLSVRNFLGADTNWKQTSYNGNMRGNYAGIGYTMSNVATLGVGSTDIFISQQPHMLLGLLVLLLHGGIHRGDAPALTDDQIAAGSYYEWDEAGYQADTSDPKTVGSLTTPA